VEVDEIIYKIIEQADMGEMVDFANARDDIIESVGELIYKIYNESGIEEVKKRVEKKLKVIV
jgi:hypothetical protein